MPLFLYDCLRVVRLQHLYARFNSLGICHAAHLSVLNREDYPLLGIHTMEDRTRFVQLVQFIKTLDPDSSLGGCNEGGTVDCHNSYGTTHDEDSIGAAVSNPIASTSARPSHVCTQLDFSNETSHHRKRLSHPVVHINASHARYEELIQGKESATSVWHHFKPKSKRATVASRTLKHKPLQHNNRKGATKKKNLYTEMSTDGCMCKEIPVYEAKRTAGYNYGLPLSTPPAQSKLQSKEKRIKVCVRKRPLTCAESKGEADVVTTAGEECVIVHEDKEAVDLSQYILQHKFYFDQVFGEESCNEEVYQKTAYPLVQHMLKGGKVTCFAYGQTGAGKTHTMLGSPTRPGLYALAVQDIFAHLATTHSSQLVYVSFFEIYCGQLYDLLDHRKRLYAREDGRRMVHISGLREVRVDSVSLLLKVISQGTAERTQGMSGVNPLSSRSHALLHIQLRDPNQQIAGRMWFVDLAGSERASDSKEPDRQSRLEGAEINQSLLALKECIRSLDQEQSHTPFRQSKLTQVVELCQVLKDSFVGDSMTCMIANISPGHTATEHTLNTLRYADRVKELRRQRGLRGRRRNSSKAATSPKQNLFSSSADRSVSTRGKGPPKKPKLTGQSEAFGPTSPTTRSLLGSAFLCSTPQISKCGEEANARSRGETGLEHVTPVRGWLRMGEKRHKTNGADELEGGRIGNDRYESAERQSVCEQSPGSAQAVLVSGQPKDKQAHSWKVQKEGEAHEADLSYTERKSEFCSREEENEQHILKGGIEKGKKSREANSKGERLQERELPNTNERDKEKERHLRWYHKQLQQFTPSSASSSIHLSSPSTDPSSSSSSSSSYQGSVSHLSISSHMSHGLEQVLDGYTARSEGRVDGNRGQVLSPSGEIQLQTETSTVSNNINEEDAHGDSDGVWENSRASLEGMQAGFGQERSKSEKRISLEASTEERQRRKHEHISTPLTSDMLSDVSFKSKHTRCIPDAVSPNGHREKEPWFDATVSKRPFLYAQSATLPLTTSITPPEPLNKLPENSAHTQGHNQSDVKMTALPHNETQADSFNSIMNPPCISQLHVDRQAATLSFLRGDNSNTKVSLLKNESGKDNKRDVVENVGLPLCFVELPQVKTLHSPISETMTATNHTEGKQVIQLTNCHAAILAGVLGSIQDQESSQKQKPPTLSNIPAASPLKNLQESSSNHQIRPTIHLFNLDNLDYAKWCIFKAHWEQLKEMEALYLKEGKLLCQLPDMAFEEYVHRLEEIMEKKALCVDRIRAQLQPHLKPIPSNHPQEADNHNSTS